MTFKMLLIKPQYVEHDFITELFDLKQSGELYDYVETEPIIRLTK